jgi:hypothetical protein
VTKFLSGISPKSFFASNILAQVQYMSTRELATTRFNWRAFFMDSICSCCPKPKLDAEVHVWIAIEQVNGLSSIPSCTAETTADGL